MRLIVIALTIFSLVTGPAWAGQRKLGLKGLMTQCAKGNCERAVGKRLEANDLDQAGPEDQAEFIGILALAIFEVARHAEEKFGDRPKREKKKRKRQEKVADALRGLADIAINEDQAQRLDDVADMIENGDAELFDLEDPFLVSPS